MKVPPSVCEGERAISSVGRSLQKVGRLAQLVERNIDVVDARGSSPLSPTKYSGFNVQVFPA